MRNRTGCAGRRQWTRILSKRTLVPRAFGYCESRFDRTPVGSAATKTGGKKTTGRTRVLLSSPPPVGTSVDDGNSRGTEFALVSRPNSQLFQSGTRAVVASTALAVKRYLRRRKPQSQSGNFKRAVKSVLASASPGTWQHRRFRTGVSYTRFLHAHLFFSPREIHTASRRHRPLLPPRLDRRTSPLNVFVRACRVPIEFRSISGD